MLLAKLATGLVSVVLSILLLEFGMRIANPPHKLKSKRHPLFHSMLEPNQEIIWNRETDEPVLVRINSRGFRDREHTVEKPEGSVRVLMLGDSFVQALATPFEEIVAQQLEQLLQSEVPNARVEVINVGKSGWSTASELQYLRHEAPKYDFDVVVHNFFEGNDFVDNQHQREREAPYFSIQGEVIDFHPVDTLDTSTLKRALRHSALLDALRYRVAPGAAWKEELRQWLFDMKLAPMLVELGIMRAQRVRETMPVDRNRMIETSVALIAAADRAVRAQGSRFVVNVIPDPGSLLKYYGDADRVPTHARRAPGAQWRAYSDELVRALERKGIVTIRNLDRMERDARTGLVLYRGYVGHWTSEGHRRAAEDIKRIILPFVIERAAAHP